MATFQNSLDGVLPRRDWRLVDDDEPVNLSKTVMDFWGLCALMGLGLVLVGPAFIVEVALTRPLTWDDAIFLLFPLASVVLVGAIVASGWLRKTVFATDAGIQFEHKGDWWEVAWRDVGELRRASWDFRWRHALHYVDLLDGGEMSRLYFVPTPDAVACIEYYRAESRAWHAKKRRARRAKKRRLRRAKTGRLAA